MVMIRFLSLVMQHLNSRLNLRGDIGDLQNDGVLLNRTSMYYHVEIPPTTRFRQFGLIIPAFMEKCAKFFIALHPGQRKIEQQV
ncbi:hypothetical protein D3C87_1828470 [compost metagenome]